MRYKKAPKGNPTIPMFQPRSDWKPPNLSQLPSWAGQENVSIDTEFYDPDLTTKGLGDKRGVKISGYSFAFDDGQKFYVPLRHPTGNVDEQQGLNYLRDQAKHHKGWMVGANIPTEIGMLRNDNILFPETKGYKDVLIAAALINELHRSYSLDNVLKREGFVGKNQDLLKSAAQCFGADITKTRGKNAWKGMIAKLPARYVGPYGEDDAWMCLPLLKELERQLKQQDMMFCWELETDLVPVLFDVRSRGVLIDFDHVTQVEIWAKQQQKQDLDAIHAETGVRVGMYDVMKLGSCGPVVEALGLKIPMVWDEEKEKLKPSITSPWLDSVGHKVTDLLHHARQMMKLEKTFCHTLRDKEVNGRVHATFKQIVGDKDAGGGNEDAESQGTKFGRMSSVNPNFQQLPSRQKHANFFRKCFKPEPGCEWAGIDYAACEPRILTHFAALTNCTGGKAAAAAYRASGRLDPHQFMADLTGLERKPAKQVFLARCYGQGEDKMCSKELKLPTRYALRFKDTGAVVHYETLAEAYEARLNYHGEATYREVAGEEGQAIIARFDANAPYVKEMQQKCAQAVKDTGMIRLTVAGRTVHFPTDKWGKYDWSYKALNRLIQGTAGYQFKLAARAVAKEMPDTLIQLYCHDEMCGSFRSRKEMKGVAQIMQDVVPMQVPFYADVEHGPSYGELTQLCRERNCVNDINPEQDKFYCADHGHL